MLNPLVTIITVCYNSEKTIAATIQSVINQTYDWIEYLIIDGASKDRTVEIATNLLTESKLEYRIISEPDKGIYDAMNKGIKLANGKIIGIINSDDWYEEDAIEHVVENYLANHSGVYYGIQRRINGSDELSLERPHHNFLNRSMIPHSSSFISTDIYESQGVFNLKYKYVADYDLFVRLKKQNINFYPINIVLSNFTSGGASAGSKAAIESLRFKLENGFVSKKKFFLNRIRIALEELIK